MRTRASLATFVALALFLSLPGHPLSLVGGLPWGPLALGCVVLLACGAYAAWPLDLGRAARPLLFMVLLLATVKLGLALGAPRYGLEASYYANERFRNQPERSTIARSDRYTRLDTLLEFGGDEFPLYFFNDQERFNTLGPDRLVRGKSLVWSARWNGFLQVPERRETTIWLTASGPGELLLNGKSLLKVDADGRATAEARLNLEAGPHALQVLYVRKKERSGLLRVETDLAGQRQALAPPLVTAEPYSTSRLGLDRTLAMVGRGVDSLFLVLLTSTLAIAIWRRLALLRARSATLWERLERPLLALVPLGFFLEAALPRLDRVGKMVFLGGGQDWLTYETLARDIHLHGLLMTLGQPLGQGAPFFNQPFYPYYLAALHALTGEDLYGVITIQATTLGVASVLVFLLARHLFGRVAAVVTLALMLGVLVPFQMAWVTRYLLSENLFFWLMPAAILALLALVDRAPRSWQAGRPPLKLAGLAGILLGLSCLTRNPTLLYLPPALVLLWWTLRNRGLPPFATARLTLIVLVSAGLLIALMPLRNYIVSGRPVFATTGGGVNLQKMHRPSDKVRLGGIDEDPLHAMLDLDRPTREVLEYLRQDPVGYFASYLPLAAYTLGIGSALNHLLEERPVQLRPDLLVISALYLLGIVLLRSARSRRAVLLHAYIATHFLTMVVFSPYDYENRLVLPMYLFVVVFAGGALGRLGQFALEPRLRARRGLAPPTAFEPQVARGLSE